MNQKSHNQQLGKKGEDYAASYLEKKGYKIIDRNVHIKRGEIDIVAQKGDLFVFVEVKTRKDESFIELIETLSASKEDSLIRSCEEYLAKNKLDDKGYRIDLVGILIDKNKMKKIEHIEGIL